MNLPDLPTQKKLNLLRHYPMEILVYLLLFAVAFLGAWQYRTTGEVNKLQGEMKSYLYKDRETLLQALQRSNTIIETGNTEARRANEINANILSAIKSLK